MRTCWGTWAEASREMVSHIFANMTPSWLCKLIVMLKSRSSGVSSAHKSTSFYWAVSLKYFVLGRSWKDIACTAWLETAVEFPDVSKPTRKRFANLQWSWVQAMSGSDQWNNIEGKLPNRALKLNSWCIGTKGETMSRTFTINCKDPGLIGSPVLPAKVAHSWTQGCRCFSQSPWMACLDQTRQRWVQITSRYEAPADEDLLLHNTSAVPTNKHWGIYPCLPCSSHDTKPEVKCH